MWQRNRDREVSDPLHSPANPRTPLQVAVREHFTTVIQLWNPLQEWQRELWRAEAATKKSKPRLGQSGPLTGWNYFIQVNQRRLNQGLAPLELPPEYLARLQAAGPTFADLGGGAQFESGSSLFLEGHGLGLSGEEFARHFGAGLPPPAELAEPPAQLAASAALSVSTLQPGLGREGSGFAWGRAFWPKSSSLPSFSTSGRGANGPVGPARSVPERLGMSPAAASHPSATAQGVTTVYLRYHSAILLGTAPGMRRDCVRPARGACPPGQRSSRHARATLQSTGRWGMARCGCRTRSVLALAGRSSHVGPAQSRRSPEEERTNLPG